MSLEKLYRKIGMVNQKPKNMDYVNITRSIVGLVIVVGTIISAFISMDAFRVLAPLSGIILGYFYGKNESLIAGRLK